MPPPTGIGSNAWDLERLSATGRQFLLEPQSRGNILRELQERLEQEKQRRHEHQQLLRSSNNATQDENEQEQQVKDWQDSDEARKSVEVTAAAGKEEAANVPTRSEAGAPPPAPPPPPPPPPPPTRPKPNQKNKTSDISSPTTQLNLKRNESQAESGSAKAKVDKDQDQGSRASSIIVFEEIKERHSKLLEGEQVGIKTAEKNELPRISSRAAPEEVNLSGAKLSETESTPKIIRKESPRLSTQEIYEEIKACRSDLFFAGEESQSISPRLSVQEIFEETKAKNREKYSPDQHLTSSRATNESIPVENVSVKGQQAPSSRAVLHSESKPNPRSGAGFKTAGAQHDGPVKQSNAGRLSARDINKAENADIRHRLGRQRLPADSLVETQQPGGGYRAPSPAGESRESDGWDQADNRRSSILQLTDAPRRFIETQNEMPGSSAVQQESFRSAAFVNTAPCLMCLMQCLRNSGLLGNCWKTAMFELEEAFALKAVADAAVAGAGEMTPSQQTYQQPYQQVYNEPLQQRGLDLPLATDEISKWQALERLCSLRNSLKNCSHTCANEF